jgi:serine phosphatase RsbU (regulator of sigma subunit)
MEPGEILVGYSDALEEARRHGVEHGRLRLQGAMLSHASNGPEALVDGTVEAVLDWCSAAAGDDLTILACMYEDTNDGRSTHIGSPFQRNPTPPPARAGSVG